jgi:inward rectifier potassium channel
VEPWNGTPCLTFRLVNLHHNSLVDSHLEAFLGLDDQSLEGNRIRRLVPLPLLRERSFHFRLFWTAMHPIDGSSPLFGHDRASLAARNAEVLVSFRGVDETVRSPVYARQAYPGTDLRFDAAFDDIVIDRAQDDRDLDFSRLDRIHPQAAAPAAEQGSAPTHG